jgi:hypothetical protein
MTSPTAEKKSRRLTLAPSTAWTAIGCGCAAPAVLGILLVFGLLIMQMAREQRDPRWSRAALASCTQNLHAIAGALDSYEKDHAGEKPLRLENLLPLYLDAQRLRCPLSAQPGTGYTYTPTATGQAALVTCHNHGQGAVVVQADGRVRVGRAP